MRVLPWFRLVAIPAVAMLAASCSEMTEPTKPGPAVQFLIISGNNQSGIAGQELPQPIRVQATDINNAPVPNTVVNFVVTAGGGSVFAGAAITDASGFAADIWRLGPVAGTPQTLEVRAVDASGVKHVYGTFTAIAGNAAPTTIVKFDGDGQSAPAGTAVTIAPAVKITDQLGNPVSGQNVTFSVTAGGGNVTGANAVTDGAGVARVGSWVLGAAAGPNSLTATAAALPGSPVTFSATGTGGGTGSLTIATAPSSTVQNAIAFAVQPAIQLRNELGQPLAQAGVQITAVTGGGASATGTTTALTDGTGKATFTGLSLTGVVGNYVVTFSATGFSSVNSASIGLTPGAAANMQLVSGDGQSVNAGTAVPILPSVRVTDVSGNLVQGATVTFSVTQGGGSVSGPTQITGANGVATVGGWTLGPSSGPNQLGTAVTGVGSPVTFTATALGNFWSGFASMPVAQRYTASAILNGILYVIGGRSAGGGALNTNNSYNPATNTWTTKTHSIAARVGAAAVTLNGKIYLIGGSTGSGAQLTTLATMEVYDPATNAWTFLAPMPTARDFLAAGVINGIIYVSGGGLAGVGLQQTTYSYDPATNVWTPRASLPAARGDVSGAVVGGLFYVVGGTAIGTGIDGRILAYNPLTDAWTTLAAMPTPRAHINVEVVNGLVYAISGLPSGMTTASTAVQAYDPATNTWISRASMTVSRYGSGLGFLNGVLYVSGGYTGSATLNTSEKYVP